jgi:hypothetical protein
VHIRISWKSGHKLCLFLKIVYDFLFHCLVYKDCLNASYANWIGSILSIKRTSGLLSVWRINLIPVYKNIIVVFLKINIVGVINHSFWDFIAANVLTKFYSKSYVVSYSNFLHNAV